MPASFSEIEPYIIQSESHGQNFLSSQNYDYPNSTASGYFQITNSTLRGVPSSITGGVTTASDLTFAQQQQAANYLWDTTGGTAWTNWNPQIAAANNAILAGNTPSYQPSSGVMGLIQNQGDPNISINQAYPDASGVPSYQNPTSDQNLTNYGYFGQQPASNAIGNELSGTTDTSLLNANADQLLSDNYAETPTLSGTTDVGSGLTAVTNPLDNSGNFDLSNAGNYGFFGLPTDTGNSLVTGAASTLGAVNQGSSWWNWFVGVSLDFIERFGLIILGIVLIAGAAWALSREARE